MSLVVQGPDHWFERDMSPRIMKGSVVKFGPDPTTGETYTDFGVIMTVADLYVDHEKGGVMADIEIRPKTNPDEVECHVVPIEYLELMEQ